MKLPTLDLLETVDWDKSPEFCWSDDKGSHVFECNSSQNSESLLVREVFWTGFPRSGFWCFTVLKSIITQMCDGFEKKGVLSTCITNSFLEIENSLIPPISRNRMVWSTKKHYSSRYKNSRPFEYRKSSAESVRRARPSFIPVSTSRLYNPVLATSCNSNTTTCKVDIPSHLLPYYF